MISCPKVQVPPGYRPKRKRNSKRVRRLVGARRVILRERFGPHTNEPRPQ